MLSKKQIFSLLIISNFLIISCSSSSSSKKKNVAAQRAVETREYATDAKTLMSSSIGAFQDLGFTIDTISDEFLLITASKIEKPVVEKKKKDKIDAGDVLFGIFIIAAALALDDVFGDSDDTIGSGGGGTTTVVKDYKLTATLTVKPISTTEPVLSSIRVNFGGSKRSRSLQFFKEFFVAIDQSLFLEDSFDLSDDTSDEIID
tara:strand:+ start:1619 stop:2227 length:609 start_codon:yes stop_codon:yes gene_type:complete